MCDQPIGCILEHRKLIRFTKWLQLHQACHTKMDARLYQYSESSAQPLRSTLSRASTMTDKPKQQKRQDAAILSLDLAIGLVNIAKEVSSMTPAPAVFGVATILLTTIKVSYILREWDVPDSNVARKS